MKITKPFTLDSVVYERFAKFVNSGERSQIIEQLIIDYLNTNSPDKKALKAQREKERLEAEERLAKLMSIDKAEAESALKENERKQSELLKAQESTQRQHFLDSCRKQAKILVNVEFGLDPLNDIIPNKWDKDKRDKYRDKWKELTDNLISERKE